MSEEKPLILLVDDDPGSLKVMSGLLSEAYRISATNSGQTCLLALKSLRPDLIICDVLMPDLDGFSLCRSIKSDPAYADIPLIFLTSLTQADELLAGFAAGAVDYLTKPVHAAELLARVQTHTELKRARDRQLETSRHLEVLNHRLEALNAEKDHLLGIVAHDLRNPISAIFTAQHMLSSRAAAGEALSARLFEIIEKACFSADSLIQELLEMAELDSPDSALQLQPVQGNLFLQDIIASFQNQFDDKGIHLLAVYPAAELTLRLNPVKMSRALGNLLQNALKFTASGGSVTVSLSQTDYKVIFTVQDTGIGIPEALQPRLFDKFTSARRRGLAGEKAHGLGMYITRGIVQRHEGNIELFSRCGEGSCFTITLPL